MGDMEGRNGLEEPGRRALRGRPWLSGERSPGGSGEKKWWSGGASQVPSMAARNWGGSLSGGASSGQPRLQEAGELSLSDSLRSSKIRLRTTNRLWEASSGTNQSAVSWNQEHQKCEYEEADDRRKRIKRVNKKKKKVDYKASEIGFMKGS